MLYLIIYKDIVRFAALLIPMSNIYRDPRGHRHPLHFRLDVDASFDINHNKFSMGVIVRDALGRVCGTQTYKIRNPSSIVGAESMAIRGGMGFCSHLRLANACIFSNSLEAVRAVHNNSLELGLVRVLAVEIRCMFDITNFTSINYMRQ